MCRSALLFIFVLVLSGCQAARSTGSDATLPSPPPATSSKALLTVTVSGTGSGMVSSSPAGIDCGSSCQSSFKSGTSVTLTALPQAGSAFVSWQGSCSGASTCTVVLNSATSVSVVFNKSTVAALNHFILMFQENRSFDQILGHLPQYWQKHGYPAVQLDGTPANASNPGLDGTSVVSAFHMISVCVENTNPAWSSAHIDHNLNDPISMVGTMDGFVTSAARHAQGANLQDVAGIRAMGYYNGDDLPYYYFMASNFATSDRWFSSVLSRSEPNHAYAMSGTSAGHAYPRPPGSPTLTNKTIFQLLDENNISWKIYYTDLDTNGTPDTALQDFSYYSVNPENIVSVQPTYFNDVAHGTLPQVAWIGTGRNSGLDEHPGEDDSNPGGSVQVGSHY